MNNTLRIIDLEYGARIAGGKQEFILDMLTMLMKSLPEEKEKLKTAFQENDLEKLAHYAHQLRGGTAYCGVPRLHQAFSKLEIAIKSHQTHQLVELYQQLCDEIAALENAYEDLLNEKK